jgi:hypothetical protein
MTEDGTTSDQHRLLHRAMRSILRPLARVAVARGLPLSALNQILKDVLVDAAQVELKRRGEKPTQSRISVLSGVHRKDVRDFLSQTPERESAREPVSRAESVVGRWLGDPAYRDAEGRPLELPRTGAAPSFEALVAGISTDVRPRTVLDELKRLGFVRHDEAADTVALDTGAFVPSDDEAHLLRLFEANLADHAQAAGANVTGSDGPFLERAVYYTHLPAAAVDELHARARADSRQLLEKLNAEALARQRRDAAGDGRGTGDGDGAPLQRFRFGVYFYREDMPEGDAPGDTTSETGRGGRAGSGDRGNSA